MKARLADSMKERDQRTSVPLRGDVLVLAEWDRATRSMLDGIRIIERGHEQTLPMPVPGTSDARLEGVPVSRSARRSAQGQG